MSEFFDDLINDALGEFRDTEATSPGLVPGAAAVRATAKHRRTVRLTTLSVLGALLIATPIAAFAANPHGNNSPPMPGESHTPSPVVSASESPTEPPSSAPSTPAAPDGRITAAQLSATAVDIPAFVSTTCPVKNVKPAAKDPRELEQPWIAKVVYTNLDDDQALETAALLMCRTGEAPDSQVVAFDRDAGGQIHTLGQIVGQGYMLNILDIDVRAGGGITANVSDLIACCGTPVSEEQHQQREYAWNGTKFAQAGGPTLWGDPHVVTDLQVLVGDVTLGPADSGGKRSGTVTVTVRNNGPNSSGRFQVGFGGCTFSCADGMPYWAWGSYGTYQAPLAAGKSVSTTVNVSFDANTPGGDIEARLIVVGVSDDKEISDLKQANNTTVFHVRVS